MNDVAALVEDTCLLVPKLVGGAMDDARARTLLDRSAPVLYTGDFEVMPE